MANAGPSTAAAPVPADFAQWIIPNESGGYNITPTGLDDSAHIQWAVDNADTDGRILLATGNDGASDFYLSHGILASNFVGSISGDGRDRTVLHTLNGYDAEMPFSFFYDRRLGYSWVGQGHLDIGNFKLVVDGPTVEWINHRQPSVEVPGVVFIIDLNLLDLVEGESPQPWPDTGVDVSVHDIWAVGQRMNGKSFPWGSTLLWPVDIEFLQGSQITIANLRADETNFTYLQPLYDCHLDIDRFEGNKLVGWGLTIYLFGGGAAVHDGRFNNTNGVALGVGSMGAAVSVNENIIHSVPRTGIYVFGSAFGNQAGLWDIEVFGNQIAGGTKSVAGIAVRNVLQAQVTNNTVIDSDLGISLESTQAYVSDNTILRSRLIGIAGFDSNVTLLDNTIMDGRQDGVVASVRSEVNAEDNRIWNNGGYGFVAERRSSIVLRDNTLSFNRRGDAVADATSSITEGEK